MSISHSLEVVRCGDNWTFSGPLQDGSGNALPLTGATITWKLHSLDLSKTYLTLTLGSGVTITNMTTATVLYGPDALQTSALSPGTYYDFLIVVLSDGSEYTVIEGLINALPGA